jgi:hypothetical protein
MDSEPDSCHDLSIGGWRMVDIGITGIFFALLWIGWELHQIAQAVFDLLKSKGN